MVYPITSKWDVPLMVSKGFASLTYLHDAAATFQHKTDMGKVCHLYYFGDHDPSGVDIRRDIQTKIADYAPGAAFEFHDVAVLAFQIVLWSLPTRPTKRSDSRAKGWKGESVELDAIDPQQLRTLVEDSIASCIDADVLESEIKIQELESETLSQYVENFYNWATKFRGGGAGESRPLPACILKGDHVITARHITKKAGYDAIVKAREIRPRDASDGTGNRDGDLRPIFSPGMRNMCFCRLEKSINTGDHERASLFLSPSMPTG